MPLVTLTPFISVIPETLTYYSYTSSLSPIAYWRLGDVTRDNIDDDFTGIDGSPPNPALWHPPTYDPTVDSGATQSTITLQNNTVDFSIITDVANGFISSKYSLTGDFDIQVDFELLAFTELLGDEWTAALMIVDIQNLDVLFSGDRALIGRFGSNKGPYRSSGGATGGTADTVGKFRLVRTGSNVDNMFWNGSDWTSISVEAVTTGDVFIRLYNRTWDANQTNNVRFDNFIVNSGTITSNIAADDTGSYDGSYSGNPTQNVPSLLQIETDNPAVTFDGVDDIGDVTPVLNTIRTYITGSVAYLATSSGTLFISDSSRAQAYIYTSFNVAGCQFYFVLDDAAPVGVDAFYIQTDNTYIADIPYHLAFVQDDTEGCLIYVNGELQSTFIGQGVPNAKWYNDLVNLDSVGINHLNRPIPVFSSGTVDEMTIFDYRLSSAEISQMFALTGIGTYFEYMMSLSPIAYWRLGEPENVLTNAGFDPITTSSSLVLSDNNKTVTNVGLSWKSSFSSQTISAGQVKYFEIEIVQSVAASDYMFGPAVDNSGIDTYLGSNTTPTNAGIFQQGSTVFMYVNDGFGQTLTMPGAFVSGDVLGVKFQYTGMLMTVYKNGVEYDTIDYTAAPISLTQYTGPVYIGVSLRQDTYANGLRTIESEFSYPIPAGATAWSTELLPSVDATDAVGSYDGTYVNSPALGTTGLLLDGSVDTAMTANALLGQMVTTSSIPSVNPTVPFSASMLVQLHNSTSSFQILALFKSTTGDPLIIAFNQGFAGYTNLLLGSPSTWGENGTDLPTGILTGDVSHFVLTFDGAGTGLSNYKLYNNGIEYPLVSTAAFGVIANPTGHEFPHHRQATNYDAFVNATIDEVIMYDKVLTSIEVISSYLKTGLYNSPYADYVNSLTPIGYWRLGELSGTIAEDEVGTFDGTYISVPTLNTPSLLINDINPAVFFNGINEYVDLNNSVSTLKTHSTGSVSFIANFPVGGECSVSMADASDNNTYLYFLITESSIWFRYNFLNGTGTDNFTIATDAGYTADTTHHICMVQDDVEGCLIYVNGVLQATSVTAGTAANKWFSSASQFDTLAINSLRRSSPVYYNGTVDEVAIFSHQLSQAEITNMYQKSIGN